jgi:hypothetical protein
MMANVFAISTEPTKPPSAAPVQQRGQAFLPLILSVFLLMLGLPRFVSSVTTLPAQQAVEGLLQGRNVSDEALESSERQLSLARHFSTSGRLAIDLASVKLAEADRLPNRAQGTRAGLVADGIELLEQGLADDPTSSFGWSRLAHGRNLEDGPGPEAVDAWRMSVLMAPADRRLALWRTRFGIESALGFAEGDQFLLDRQVHFAWIFNPTELANYAKAAGLQVSQTIRAALSDQPDDLKRFDEMTR